jgi:hypothetical protein
MTVNTADAAVAATDQACIYTKLETLRVTDLQWGTANAKPIVIQFGCKGPAGTYTVTAQNGAVTRAYTAEFIINPGEANLDVQKTVQIPGDQAGTWDTTTPGNIGLILLWGLMAGTSRAITAGSWQTVSATVTGSPNQFNWMGTNGNVFELFDVGVFAGTVAPAYVAPDFASEVVACQRYFETGTEPYQYMGNITGSQFGYGSIKYRVLKCKNATVTLTGWTYWSGGSGAAYPLAAVASNLDQFWWNNTTTLTNFCGWTGVGTWIADARP